MPSWVSFISPSLTSTFSSFHSFLPSFFSSIYSNSTRSCNLCPRLLWFCACIFPFFSLFFFLKKKKKLGFPPPQRNRIIIITLFLFLTVLSLSPTSLRLFPSSSNSLFPSVYLFTVPAKPYPHIPVSPILHIHFPTTQHITLAERESNSLPITVYFDPGISCGRDFSTDLPSYPFSFFSLLISTSSLFPSFPH